MSLEDTLFLSIPELRKFIASRAKGLNEDDVAQTVLLKAIEYFATEDSAKQNVASVTAMLKTIAGRTIVDEVRRRATRERHIASLGDNDELLKLIPGMNPTASSIARRRESAEVIMDAIEQLPEVQSAAMVEVYANGQSYQGAADSLGISIGKLHGQLRSAKQAVRALLRSCKGTN